MDKEMLDEMEKYCLAIEVTASDGDDKNVDLANKILKHHFTEIFRLARVGLRDELRQMGLE